jgi:hippurate hydrolase
VDSVACPHQTPGASATFNRHCEQAHMPIINRVVDYQSEIVAWRRDLHAHPELMYDLPRTSAFVADKLVAFGCDEVATGLGRTGVVGVIRGRKAANGAGPKVVALRADMDALPVTEITGAPYASTDAGKMHACGHDGHTAMLLGAAKYLAETRNFAGSAVLVFQPAEEGGAGARAMMDDGLLERFGIDEIYGMHNFPGLPVGRFAIRPGSIMAASDYLEIAIEGRGGHAARPHLTVDALLVGAQIVNQVQSIVARNVDPVNSAVISICTFKAGHTDNVVPQTAFLTGTARSLSAEVQDLVEARLREVVEGIARIHGATATLEYERNYPPLVNDARATAFAASVARAVAGDDNVDDAMAPLMIAEDFSFLVQKRPGAYIFVGNGDSAGLHHPAYDFNEEAIPFGVSYWARVVETAMPA